MSAPVGNEFWRRRSAHGRDQVYQSAEELLKDAEDYFLATDQRKWVKKDWVGKDAIEVERKNETPYTLAGFCIHIGRSRSWWNSFKKLCEEKKDQDFLDVISRIEDIMYTQKFEGASVGAFNANIISRDLGLADKRELDVEKNVKQTIKIGYGKSNQSEQ